MTDQEIENFIREETKYFKAKSGGAFGSMTASELSVGILLGPVWLMGYVLFWVAVMSICFGVWYIAGWLLWVIASLLGIL